MPPWEGALFGVSVRLKSIVKHRILGLRKTVNCAKMRVLILMNATSYERVFMPD